MEIGPTRQIIDVSYYSVAGIFVEGVQPDERVSIGATTPRVDQDLLYVCWIDLFLSIEMHICD